MSRRNFISAYPAEKLGTATAILQSMARLTCFDVRHLPETDSAHTEILQSSLRMRPSLVIVHLSHAALNPTQVASSGFLFSHRFKRKTGSHFSARCSSRQPRLIPVSPVADWRFLNSCSTPRLRQRLIKYCDAGIHVCIR